jgi:protein kinase A
MHEQTNPVPLSLGDFRNRQIAPLQGSFGERNLRAISQFKLGRIISTGLFAHHRIATFQMGDDHWGNDCKSFAMTCCSCAHLLGRLRFGREKRMHERTMIQSAHRSGFSALNEEVIRIIVHMLAMPKYTGTCMIKIESKVECRRRNLLSHVKHEYEVWRKMNHPHIVTLLSTFHDTRCFYWVTEFLPGGDMFDHLKCHKRFSEKEVLFWSSEIISAFSYLHDQDIIHRYLQPENILITASGHIKLKEMGLARQLKTNEKARTFCGIPEYLSCEMLQGKPYGTPADCWSLGILMYELSVGLPPFYDKHKPKMFTKIIYGDLRFPSFLETCLRKLITELLCRDPQKRMTCNAAKSYLTLNYGINWDQVYANEREPPYIPKINEKDITALFSIYETPQLFAEIEDKNWGTDIFEDGNESARRLI